MFSSLIAISWPGNLSGALRQPAGGAARDVLTGGGRVGWKCNGGQRVAGVRGSVIAATGVSVAGGEGVLLQR